MPIIELTVKRPVLLEIIRGSERIPVFDIPFNMQAGDILTDKAGAVDVG